MSFAANFSMLNSNTAPPGADYGNYLTQVNILQGNDLRGWGLRHQPLFFYFLSGVMTFFDAFTALKVASAFVFAIIAVPFFLLARKLSGDNYAAVITTALFTFFISSSEMISWGGDPNFLGFSFMLLALCFIVDVVNKPSKISIVLSGLFLSLVIGTHILVAVFTFGSLFLFAVLRIVFVGKRKETIKGNFAKVFSLGLAAAVFSLPYVSFYLTFFRNSSSEMVGFRLFDIQMGTFSLVGLWDMILFFVIAVVGALGLFAMVKYFKENKNSNLILLSILLAPFILVLTTAQPIRWLYFLPIPFLLGFTLFLKHLHFDVRQVKRITIILFTSLFMITILLQSSYLTGRHFSAATEFYQFIGNEEVKALNWIKDVNNIPADAVLATSGTNLDIGGGGNSYAWWIEGYSNRTCMFTGDLEYYSFQFERDNVRTTNRIFSGTSVFECGNLSVTDSYPANIKNPQISLISGNKNVGLLTVNDGQNQLFYSPTENPQAMSIAPFYSDESKTVNIQNSSSHANLLVTYETSQFELSRSVILGEENTSVDILYQIHPINVTLHAFKINLWSLFPTSLQNCSIQNDSLVMLSGQSSETDLNATIRLVETNGELMTARVLFENPKSSTPIVNYVFEPTNNDLLVHLRVTINSLDPATEDQTVQRYDSYDLLNELNVSYIVLNKYRDTELQRFSADTSHFTPVYQNDRIVIFNVVKG
ncbi:MAG: 6-pyruvoyl-tetrahydropterin synthase-related protein [Candidatus Bathyarchaeota archaeon]|nr:6-pyruvoyl-tetrahydropterin synthase-related protein [Candidatus Bathyarchaeota archaeon]